MPLLTELAETVVDSDSYKHAAPTELAVSWRSRCYKQLSIISVISCSNPSQQFRTESETPWTGKSETCPTPGSSLGHIPCSCSCSSSSCSCPCPCPARSRRLRGPAGRRPALHMNSYPFFIRESVKSVVSTAVLGFNSHEIPGFDEFGLAPLSAFRKRCASVDQITSENLDTVGSVCFSAGVVRARFQSCFPVGHLSITDH